MRSTGNNNLPIASQNTIDNYQLSIVNYFVIGISNSLNLIFSNDVLLLLQKHSTFSGGKRHYKLVKHLLPANHQWIDISGDMQALFDTYSLVKHSIVVFASGDPLFYGFVNTIKKHHPSASITVYPTFNSLQLLCHKKTIPYQNIVNTSVHGRSWFELDEALINQVSLIGVLTDAAKSPASIAKRMIDYNFTNYEIIVGEALEGVDEKITSLSLTEASKRTFNDLNCVLLIKTNHKTKQFGICDKDFVGLKNRPNMITKLPIRLVSLSQLDLPNKKVLWDIGFCTASISIEAKKQFPHLSIIAFEKREECNEIFEQNTRIHSTPGITKIMGDFFNTDFSSILAPDTIFVGGHGNRLDELMKIIDLHLSSGGRIVINAVKEESKESFIKSVKHLNYHLFEQIEITIDEHNPITILTAQKN